MGYALSITPAHPHPTRRTLPFGVVLVVVRRSPARSVESLGWCGIVKTPESTASGAPRVGESGRAINTQP
jgi:hypothetical protein